MSTFKRNFVIQIPDDIRGDFADVAAGANTDDTKYAAQVIKELSKLKPEYALRWVACIPLEWYKRGPGRPSTATRKTDALAPTSGPQLAAKDVA